MATAIWKALSAKPHGVPAHVLVNRGPTCKTSATSNRGLPEQNMHTGVGNAVAHEHTIQSMDVALPPVTPPTPTLLPLAPPLPGPTCALYNALVCTPTCHHIVCTDAWQAGHGKAILVPLHQY